jgi:hypothetical protein
VENEDKPLKVNKKKFDEILSKLLGAKPKPRTQIKTEGKRGSKKPIIGSKE